MIHVNQPYDRFQELSTAGALVDYRQTFTLAAGDYWLIGAAVDEHGGRTATRSYRVSLPQDGAACLSATPLMLAPAMNADMWANPITQRNMTTAVPHSM